MNESAAIGFVLALGAAWFALIFVLRLHTDLFFLDRRKCLHDVGKGFRIGDWHWELCFGWGEKRPSSMEP